MDINRIKDLKKFATNNSTDDIKRILEELVQQGKSELISKFPSKKMYTPLHTAASRGSVEALKLLLEYKFDVNVLDTCGNTAMHEACRVGNIEIIDILLQHPSIDVSKKNRIGATALHYACMKGLKTVGTKLIQRGAELYACTDIQTLATDYLSPSARKEMVDLYEVVNKEKRERERELKRANRAAAKIAATASLSANERAEYALACVVSLSAGIVARHAVTTILTRVNDVVAFVLKVRESNVAEIQKASRKADLVCMCASTAALQFATNAVKTVEEARAKQEEERKETLARQKEQQKNVKGTDASKDSSGVSSNGNDSDSKSGATVVPNGDVTIPKLQVNTMETSKTSPGGGTNLGSGGGDASNSTGSVADNSIRRDELHNWLEKNKPEGQQKLECMSVADVKSFLNSMGLTVLANGCESQSLDGEMLLVITRQQLDEIEVGSSIHRYKLLKLIERYRSESEALPGTSISAPNSPREGGRRTNATPVPTASAPTSPRKRARSGATDSFRYMQVALDSVPEDNVSRSRAISAVSSVSTISSGSSGADVAFDISDCVDRFDRSLSPTEATHGEREMSASTKMRHHRSFSAPPKPASSPASIVYTTTTTGLGASGSHSKLPVLNDEKSPDADLGGDDEFDKPIEDIVSHSKKNDKRKVPAAHIPHIVIPNAESSTVEAAPPTPDLDVVFRSDELPASGSFESEDIFLARPSSSSNENGD